MFSAIKSNVNYSAIRLASQFNKSLEIKVGGNTYVCSPPALHILETLTSTDVNDLYCLLLNDSGLSTAEFSLNTAVIEVGSSISEAIYSSSAGTGELTLAISEEPRQLSFSF